MKHINYIYFDPDQHLHLLVSCVVQHVSCSTNIHLKKYTTLINLLTMKVDSKKLHTCTPNF